MSAAQLVLALSFFPVLYISIFLHELGHAVCGWAGGYRITSFGMGLGKPLVVIPWRGTRVFFCRQRPLQGITFSVAPQLLPGRGQVVLMLSGGVLAHLLLMSAMLVAAWGLPRWEYFWLLAAALNALLALVNLIPISMAMGGTRFRSDGAQIWRNLRYGSASMGATSVLHVVHWLESFWEAIDDRLILNTFLTAAALRWFHLGDEERARWHLNKAALPVETPPANQAYLAAVRAHILNSGDGMAEAAALAEAEKVFHALGHANGLFLVRWLRAHLLLRQGDPEAGRELAILAASPVAVLHPLLQVSLLADRVQACCTEVESPLLETLLAEYEAAPKALRNDVDQLSLYRALAGWRRERGGPVGATAAYEKALEAAAALDNGLAWSPEAQAGFRQRQAPLLEAARASLCEVGRAEQAERLATFFPSQEELAQREAEQRRGKNARRVRIGLELLLADGLVGAILWVLGNIVRSASQLKGLAVVMAVFMAFAAIVVTPLLLGYLFFPAWRTRGGNLVLFLGIIPLPSLVPTLVLIWSDK